MTDNLDLVSRLSEEDRLLQKHAFNCICHDDAKY